MSFDTLKTQSLRNAFTIVEIYLDINDPALDSEFATQSDSYGTPKTTDDARAYTGVDFRVYRYSDQNIFGLSHFPGLEKATSNPPKIDPGKSIGFRANGKIELIDFESDDSFELPSPYNDRRVTGSHFKKLFSRNHLINRRLKIIRGYNPDSFDLNNCQVENYVIDDFTYPDRNGKVTIDFVDELILAESKKAKAPLVSKGELSSGITAGASSLTYTSIDPDEYGAVSATGYIAIEKEIIEYTVDTVTASGGALTLDTRAALGTSAKAHSAGETIQKVIYYDNENIIDIFTDLITNYTNIPASYIPTADWNALKADELSSYTLTRALFKPEDVKKLLNDLIRIAGLSMYVDVINQEIVIVPTPDFASPVITFDETQHIEQVPELRVRRMPKEQITRQTVYWDKFDPTEGNEDSNYRKIFQVIDGIVETDADEGVVSEAKPLKSEWTKNTTDDNQLMTNFCRRQVNRFSRTPIQATFEVDESYIGTVSGGRFWLGSIFELASQETPDAGLNPQTLTYQCIEIKPGRSVNKWSVTGLSYIASVPVEADLYIDEDKTDYLLTDELTTTEAREYTVVIASGVKVCASSTANAAFRQGTFFAGATLKLVNLGQILGYGGDGGDGGNAGPSGGSCVSGAGTNGLPGGDALDLTTDATIDNGFGLIYGGGGGGAGEDGECPLAAGGRGGGGGQGCINGGTGGNGGSGDTNGIDGQDGSISSPGALNGGAWGEDGGDGATATGGAGGKAIELNGNSATITNGNNSEQIKGDVS